MTETVVLGLGSNQGDRAAHLRAAVALIGECLGALRVSRLYRSPAMLPEDAPPEWDVPFLNMAVKGETPLAPQALLTRLQAMEISLGRVRRGVWGPREIDIDLLVYGDRVLNEPELQVPHAGLLARDFALLPLADCWPEWPYPVTGAHYGRSARELAAACAGSGLLCLGDDFTEEGT